MVDSQYFDLTLTGFVGLVSMLGLLFFLSMQACTCGVRAKGFNLSMENDLEGFTSASRALDAWETSILSGFTLVISRLRAFWAACDEKGFSKELPNSGGLEEDGPFVEEVGKFGEKNKEDLLQGI